MYNRALRFMLYFIKSPTGRSYSWDAFIFGTYLDHLRCDTSQCLSSCHPLQNS